MSSYQIDPEPSTDERFTFVKLSGRAEPETILKLLDELSALAERNTSLRILIDETSLGAGFIGPADIGRADEAGAQARLVDQDPQRRVPLRERAQLIEQLEDGLGLGTTRQLDEGEALVRRGFG